ncbi:hypothetical protein [Aminobacter carboxidus]|uniref:Tail fiber protein n=1 Tax=Aminobacter carboxidus TaxID=376165 RepID=A0ABR9GWN3_9HYPH|nr:hypothetical protein [Aminobacter carboxidus]MBE1208100.1 hypothetical protein [Aminobacter carboxidus]
MSQSDFGTINPTTKSGTALATDLMGWRDAVHSGNKGPTAPSYVTAGLRWVDDTLDPIWLYKFYDGTNWITVFAIDTTTNQTWAVNSGEKMSFLLAGGAANALTLTLAVAMTAYVDLDVVTFEAASNNTAAATLNISSIGAKAIRKMVGGADVALAAGDILDGGRYILNYDTAANSAAGAWILVNPSFLVLKQATTATPTGEGQVEWDTDDNVLAIGDGAGTQLFVPIPASTAAGDTEYFTAAKAKARLAKGTAGQKYQMNAGATAPEWADGIAGGTNIATTSGTAIDVTSIPTNAKKITINFSGVSTNGTSLVIVQLGDSGGIETSGYGGCTSGITNAVITNAHSTGFIVHTNNSAAATIHGSIELTREDLATNTWAASITTGLSDAAYVSVGGGSKALSAPLDRVRITTVAGTNTFDAGSLNVTYEV